jgi:hypothetical protein
MRGPTTLAAAGVLALLLAAPAARGEPYLAVQSGYKCMTCHTNPSGGGKRTAFGLAYASGTLSRTRWSPVGGDEPWTGDVSRWLAVGADLRASYQQEEAPEQPDRAEFDLSRATIYAELRAIPGRLTFYVDQHVAPGGSINREAYALITPESAPITLKAGKFFLPFGFRLEDDTAFVRQFTGINFATPDQGIEAGLELDRWSAQLAFTNGTAGAPDNDTSKQVSIRASYIRPSWRAGASFNVNDAELGDRRMAGLFAGLRTGPVAWLAEIDVITDDLAGGGEQQALAGLIEANWQVARGHNLKIGYEVYDPDDDVDADDRSRASVVWEFWAFQSFQSRVGIRSNDGIESLPLSNADLFFAELHVYF